MIFCSSIVVLPSGDDAPALLLGIRVGWLLWALAVERQLPQTPATSVASGWFYSAETLLHGVRPVEGRHPGCPLSGRAPVRQTGDRTCSTVPCRSGSKRADTRLDGA